MDYINQGLSNEEVEIRINNNQVNYDTSIKTKSIPKIIFYNIFTLFNMLNLILALLIFLVGSYKNLLFLGVVICNTLISTFQEIRTKLIIDKLSVVTRNKVKVIRNGINKLIDLNEIVIDDLLVLKAGNQVVVDSIILDNEVYVDESFITGESDTVLLKKGDLLKSGSFIVVGSCKAKVVHIGEDNYTAIISKDAKYIKKTNSILMNTLNKIIKIISIIIIPTGILLFLNQYGIDNNIENAVVSTVAGLISMIPEGLILLTSTVLAVSVIRLSKYNVLVQELYCIEMLAYVDTLCIDKTGTITEGTMKVKDVVLLKKVNIDDIMGNLVSNLNDDNATLLAIKDKYKKKDNYKCVGTIPFSSYYKYSGANFEKEGTYIIGAHDFICKKEIKELKQYLDYRVLLLMHSNTFMDDKDINKLEPIAIIVLEDNIRLSAARTFEYFKKQNVKVKIISGDNVKTVVNIAKKIGLDDINSVDASNLSDEELKKVVLKANIFGRVSPLQKRKIIEYLKENNKTVAFVGDGVNDVLALKEADCSVALASGSDVARNVSQLVLLDSNFDSLPYVLREGRRTINNVERSASLFITKTVYAFILSILFIFVNWTYPFMPIQASLSSMFTIGIPSFILALEPNNEKIDNNFLARIISKAIPSGLTVVFNIVFISLLSNLSKQEVSTLAISMIALTGFILIFKISKPFNKLRKALFVTIILGFSLGVIIFKDFFGFASLSIKLLTYIVVLLLISIIVFNLVGLLVNNFIEKHPKLFKEV